MNVNRPSKRDIVEIFGYAPNDTTNQCRSLWNFGRCPFTKTVCLKKNHDSTVIYGTCSVTTAYGDCIICPNRLYFDHFSILRRVSRETFGDLPFYTFNEYFDKREETAPCVVALGMHSGHEINIRSLSMDWVLTKIINFELVEYVGIEVQSIDITGNYRDNWYAYKNIKPNTKIPNSEHGLNWANVRKRLIPQIIQKSLVYSQSKLVKSGLYFIVPEIVYKKFEDVLGTDIPLVAKSAPNIITVHTYGLENQVPEGQIRKVSLIRKLKFTMEDFSHRFISGPNLPKATELDTAIRKALGLIK